MFLVSRPGSIAQRPLGATGLHPSVLGFGGAPIGFADAARESTSIPLVRRALDLGINFFDTAPDYRRSEELLGEALRGRRAEVVLATKVGRTQTPRGGEWMVRECWSTADVERSIEQSLRRLRTDYLDLVQLHSPPRWVLDEGGALTGLVRAQQAGKVRHLGISADGAEAWQALELGVFATLQVSYSVLQQEPGSGLLPAAAARGMGIIAKQPLANGVPAMPSRPEQPDWAWKWDLCQQFDWTPARTGAERLALAFRWLLANHHVSTAIVGTTRPEHLKANVAAALAPPLNRTTIERFAQMYACASVTVELQAEDRG